MPLFVCDKCKAIENTATGHYWGKDQDYFGNSLLGMALCSECTPDKFAAGEPNEDGGKWHGHFPKDTATPELIRKIGEKNFIYVSDIEGVKARNPCAE